MRKWSILLMLMLTFVTGCWDRKDVDSVGIVVGLGIDYLPEDKTVLLSAQVVNPSSLGSATNVAQGKNPFFVITSEGKTIFDALRNFSRSYPRRLIFSHNKLIVMSRKFSERDLSEVIDYIDRDREMRENVWMFVTDKTAKEMMETELSIETIPAMGLDIIIKEHMKNAFSYPRPYYEFSNEMKGEIGVSTAPLIKLVEKDKKINEQLDELGGNHKKSKFTMPKEVIIERNAIFKDNKLIGSIGKNESRGFLWLRGELEGGTVILTEDENKTVSVFIQRGKTTITPTVKGDQVIMKIECEGTAMIKEVNADLDISDPKVIIDLEKQVEKKLTSRVRRTIEIAQNELEADFIGFGDHIHNKQPEEWKRLKDQWEEIFPNVEYDINFNITIKGVGFIINPG